MKYSEYKLNAIVLDDKATEFFPKTEAKIRSKAFPDHFTRSNDGIPVFDQGWMGSCVGASGKVVVRDRCFPLLDLSALWIYTRAKHYDAWDGVEYSGTSILGACIALQKEGVATEEEAPYKTEENVSFPMDAVIEASKRKINSFAQIPTDSTDAIKGYLMDYGRLWTAFNVHEQFYTTNIYGMMQDEGAYLSSKYCGGHAVALTGWKTENGKTYWEFQNSWGKRFGNGGYFYISESLYRKISPSFYCVSNEGEPKRYGLAIMYVLKIIESIKRLFGRFFK